MGHDAETFDPFSASVIADPHPWYARLHEGPRVARLEQWDIWVLHRHEDVRAAVRDHIRLSSAEGVTYIRAPLPMMLTLDPPDHERLRRIVGREFAPRDIERFRPTIERFVADGLDELDERRDVVPSLAIPVPIRVMAHILGVLEADIPELRRMSDDLVQGFSLAPSLDAHGVVDVASVDYQKIGNAILEIHEYFTSMIADRRRHPTDDLVTKLMQPADEGVLSESELLWFCLLLLVAGIETTTNLIGNMVVAFAEHPDQWSLLRERRELVASAVRETLRFDAPIQGFFRTALDDHVIDTVTIPRGSRVLLSFGAANRDPEHYEDPDEFQIDRNPDDHLAFGSGIHRCLGSGLAELEGRIVLEGLLDRIQTIELVSPYERTSNPTLRGVTRLPLRVP